MKVSSCCCALLLVVQSLAAKLSKDTPDTPTYDAICIGTLAGDRMDRCDDMMVTDCDQHYTETGYGGWVQCGSSDHNCLAVGPFCVPVGPKMLVEETYLNFEPANVQDLTNLDGECSYSKFQDPDDPEGKWYQARMKNCLSTDYKAWFAVGAENAVHAKPSTGEHYVIFEMPESIRVLGYWVTLRNMDAQDKGPRPRDWKFQGSTGENEAGTPWVTLDDQSNFEFAQTEAYFEIANYSESPYNMSYKWFRFLVTSKRGCPDGSGSCDDNDYLIYEGVKIKSAWLRGDCDEHMTQDTCPSTCLWGGGACRGTCEHSYSDKYNCPAGYRANRLNSRSTLVTVGECCEYGQPQWGDAQTFLDFVPANTQDLSNLAGECSYSKFQDPDDPEGRWYQARQKNCLSGSYKAWFAVGGDPAQAVHGKPSQGNHYVIFEMPVGMSIRVLGYWVRLRNMEAHDKGPRPRDWEFQGYGDDGYWVTLDKQRYFEFTSTEAYFELPVHLDSKYNVAYNSFRYLVTSKRACPSGSGSCDNHDYYIYRGLMIKGEQKLAN